MNSKILQYIINAVDKTGTGLKSAISQITSFTKGLFSNLANIKAGFDMAFSAVGKIAGKMWIAVKEAFKFESLTVQFAVLMGNMDAAKARMAELAEFAANTPFSMDEAVAASRQLHMFSEGAMGGSESLRIMGDAAAAVGQSLSEVSSWVGRAYSAIKNGQPFAQAVQHLQNMGVITPEVRARMEELQEAGASNIEVWQVLEDRMKSLSGGMEQMAQTGDGLISTLQDDWQDAISEVGAAFQDAAKNGIAKLSEVIHRLTEDGTLRRWADETVHGFEMVLNTAKKTWEFISDNMLTRAVRNVGVQVGALATYGVARANGNSADDAEQAANHFFGRWGTGSARDRAVEKLGYDPKEQARQETEAAKAAAKAEAEEKKALAQKNVETEAEMKRKVADDMAKAQAINDKKLAEEKAKKDAAEAEKLAKKQAEEAERLAIKEAELRERLARKLAADELDARIKGVRKEADARAESERTASDRLARAKAAVNTTWGWYRDPESFRAQLAEEKAEGDARKQFERDSDRLRRQTGWRTAKLSDEQEAVRRVLFAREEERAAQVALDAIAAATEKTNILLEELLAMK